MASLMPSRPGNRDRASLDSRGNLALKIAGVAVLYYGAARLGLLLQLPGTNASPVWPPSGIGLAAVLLFGLRVWPAILIGALLANIMTLPASGAGHFAATLIGIGNTLEHVTALLLIRRMIGDHDPFERASHVFRFVGAAALSCAVASTVGVSSLWLTGLVAGELVRTVWFTWWLGDTAGMLVLAPALYCWWRRPRPGLSAGRLVELVILSLATISVAELLFSGWIDSAVIDSLPYLVVPGLLWAAFRFGPRETATMAVFISIVAVAQTWRLMGTVDEESAVRLAFAPFVSPSLSANESLLMLQIFVCAVAVTAMTLAAAISEQRNAEAAERKLRQELERRVEARTAELATSNEALAESNLELQQFAYVASHDLQTPLRSVASFAEFLREDYYGKLDAAADGHIDEIIGGAQRMQQLISDLLEYSHIDAQAAPFESVALNDVFDDVLNMLRAAIDEAHAEVTRDELPKVEGNWPQLSQLLQNLIGNGIKYHDASPPRIHVSAKRSGSEWIIAVRDNGIGIKTEHKERVFEIFRRLHTRQAYPGTGIGLAICRRIVTRHGGRIWLESEEGKGSTFFFTITGQA